MCRIKLVNSGTNSFFAGCGIIEHPDTGNWQVWLSLYGTDVACIFASPNARIAESVADYVGSECINTYLSPRILAKEFIDNLQPDEMPHPIYPLPFPCLEELNQILKRQIFKRHIMQ